MASDIKIMSHYSWKPSTKVVVGSQTTVHPTKEERQHVDTLAAVE